MHEHTPARYGIVGAGWRAAFFLRMAKLMPHRFSITGIVSRSAERGADLERVWGVHSFRTIRDLVTAERPEFVVVSVPPSATPEVTKDLVQLHLPVLAETPPAADLTGLRELWAAVGASGLVQVAEQYLMMPSHSARLALLRRKIIGEVTSVQISSTHLYHAVSMMRFLLDVGFQGAEVTARAFSGPLSDPLSREGWSADIAPKSVVTTLAMIDFGARMALYDFTENQWLNPLRSSRFVARGSSGELVDDRVIRLVDPISAVESHLPRRQTGIELNLEGCDLDHISFDGAVVYRNPFYGARLADEDISVATLLQQMTLWCRDEGPPPYSLADACQDHLISLAINLSVKTGATVETTREAWAS